MKKILVFALAAASLFYSCGSKQEEKKAEEDAYNEYEIAGDEDSDAPASDAPASDAGSQEAASSSVKDLIAQGEALINSNDCKTCHTIENRIVGPSYNEVAAKYEFTQANISSLSEKVIAGGAGTWGDIPMTPHPNLSKADSEKMVYFILSLDGEDFKQ